MPEHWSKTKNEQYTLHQMLGSFDKVANKASQYWAFNYITLGEDYTNMKNLTPSLYVWEQANMTYDQIRDSVSLYINDTLI